MPTVEVTNRKTKVKSTLTQEQYDKVKNDPNWYRTFEVEATLNTPKEVKDLEQKKAKADPKNS